MQPGGAQGRPGLRGRLRKCGPRARRVLCKQLGQTQASEVRAQGGAWAPGQKPSDARDSGEACVVGSLGRVWTPRGPSQDGSQLALLLELHSSWLRRPVCAPAPPPCTLGGSCPVEDKGASPKKGLVAALGLVSPRQPAPPGATVRPLSEAPDHTSGHGGPVWTGESRPWKSERFGSGQEEIEKLPNQNVYFPKR